MTDAYGLGAFPWERVDGETAQAFAAFIVYRDLGPRRRQRDAAAQYYDVDPKDWDPKSGGARQFEKWSAKFRWVARAEAYDDYMQSVQDAEDLQMIKDMRKRHAQIATTMQVKAVAYLQTLTDADIAKMSPDSATRMLDIAIKNERLARGVPDTITAHTDVNGAAVKVETKDVSEAALERRFNAFMMSRDPQNEIEKGEPDGSDDLPLAEEQLE